MPKLVIDVEANSLDNPTKIWCIVTKNLDTGVVDVYRNLLEDSTELALFKTCWDQKPLWIGHNVLGWDFIHLRRLLGVDTTGIADRTIDTLILSKLIDYPRDGHSIESYGVEFGFEKLVYTDFSKLSEELVTYCTRDVEVTEKVFNKYKKVISDPKWRQAIKTEHNFQWKAVNALESNGFAFNVKKCATLLDEVTQELEVLDEEIDKFPVRVICVREVHPRLTKFDTLNRKDFLFEKGGDLSRYNGGPFCRIDYVPFNPASIKQVVDLLWSAGWKPEDRTKTAISVARELPRADPSSIEELTKKNEKFKKYGFKVNETNLNTLPDKSKCLIKIKSLNEFDNLNIDKDLKLKRELKSITTEKKRIGIGDISKTDMDLLLQILNGCHPNKTDVANFVENEGNLWSIIVTPMAMYVDFSVSVATEISDGTKRINYERKIILNNLHKLFYEAPTAARTLSRRILFEARRRTLTEWSGLVDADGRIRGRFQGIGAWTHRMSHQRPNMANIPNEFDLALKRKVLGAEMRALFIAPKNRLLVGVDAASIQLRIFAHCIDDVAFTKSIVEGKKEDKSDPHSLNKSIIGSICKSRAASKRFIFAMLLGAGEDKLAEILECSREGAKAAIASLMDRYAGFTLLKSSIIPADAKRGWFYGLDGRKVRIPGDELGNRRHLAMSGYLQNGEAVVMKMATLLWMEYLEEEFGLDIYKFMYDNVWMLVNLVHDEWQTECVNDQKIALRIAELQDLALQRVGIMLQLKCPLAGSYRDEDRDAYTIAGNWKLTH